MNARTFVLSLLLLATPLDAQQFGAAVAIDGAEVLVAEPLRRRSAATIYRYGTSGDGWEQVGTLEAPPHGGDADYFGRFIAMDGESLLVGGTLYENSTGAVWAYRRDGGEWVFDEILQAEGLLEEEAFGRFGQLHGDLLFVSSLGYRGAGAVWVFARDEAGQWSEQARLEPESPAPQEFFGWGMDYDSDRLIVGSFAGAEMRGAAYVFGRDDQGEWFQEARLALPPEESQPYDGGFAGMPGAGTISVHWLDGMALVGLPGRDQRAGTVLTFVPDPSGEWTRGPALDAPDRTPDSYFGHALQLVADELWVSAPGETASGAIHRFAYDGADPDLGYIGRIESTIDVDSGDGFGTTFVTGEDLAVVGQPGDDGALGSAVVLRRQGEEWTAAEKLFIPGEPGLPAITGAEVACGDDGLVDQFFCSSVDLLSFLPVAQMGGGRGIRTNDIWGWTDSESGREYVIVGRTDGVSFVDISDPLNPVYLGSLPKTARSMTSSWRDMKVFADHVFVVADGAGRHGMQVFDLTRLREVDGDPIGFEADVLYDEIGSAHNIVINEETGIAYAVGVNSGGETCGGGLHMIDVNVPREPVFAGCFQDGMTGRSGTGYTHDAMCVIYRGPDEEYTEREICFGANETALTIADVTDKERPVHVSTATYPNVAYAHQGWLTEDHRYFFMNDELDESAAHGGGGPEFPGTRTLIWDVTDLDDPVLAREHFGEVLSTDHNLYIRGNLMYQSNYVSGLRILNIADPVNPVEVGYIDTVPDNDSVAMSGSWSNYPFFESGTIAVASREEGLFLVRYAPRELLP